MKKAKKGLLALFLFFIFLGLWQYPKPFWSAEFDLTLAENSTPKELYTYQGTAMTMPYRVSIESSFDHLKRAEGEEGIKKIFQQMDTVFNSWNPDSEISKFNDSHNTHPLLIDSNLRRLLLLAGLVHRHSEGLYDPTIVPLTNLWRKYLQKGNIPSQEEIAKVQKSVGWEKLQFKTRDRLQKLDPNLQINFNSMVKGHAVDLICEFFNKLGCRHIYVEWAGEIRVKGGHPLNRPWIIGVKNPTKDNSANYITKIHCYEGSIATSAHDHKYRLVREKDGTMKSYSHFISPRTLQPLDISNCEVLSCTIVTPSCALADALSTAGLMQPTLSDAKEWARRIIHEFEGTEIYLYSKDNKLWHFEKAQTQSQLILY
jgi:thiamine biosynthesis lipoprotein